MSTIPIPEINAVSSEDNSPQDLSKEQTELLIREVMESGIKRSAIQEDPLKPFEVTPVLHSVSYPVILPCCYFLNAKEGAVLTNLGSINSEDDEEPVETEILLGSRYIAMLGAADLINPEKRIAFLVNGATHEASETMHYIKTSDWHITPLIGITPVYVDPVVETEDGES